ncbi:MAG: tetratricopeptide repeat protein [Saprospiraceae bacterium]|nr:tetratricopeptide repeat protein [Saprospiraceae bacterium]
MKDEDFDLLDAHFNGLLTPEESQALLLRSQTDKELAVELALREKMERFLRSQKEKLALSDNLDTIGNDYFQEETEKIEPAMKAEINWHRRIMAAAAMVVLLVAAWFVMRPEPISYQQFAQHEPLHFSVRGEADVLVTEAEKAFNAGDYGRALLALDKLLAIKPDNGTARLYKGICQLELHQPEVARTTLQPLAEGRSALRADAMWYIALGFLQENNLQQCKTTLQQLKSGDAHFEEALQLLKKL